MAPRNQRRPSGLRRRTPKSRLGVLCAMAVCVILAGYLSLIAYSRPSPGGERLRFDTFVDLAEKGRIRDARVLDEDAYVVGHFAREDGSIAVYSAAYLKTADSRSMLVAVLLENRVPTTIEQQFWKSLVDPATLLVPGLIGIVIFVYFLLSFRRGTGLFSVKSGARRTHEKDLSVTFADVAGQDPAVAELREIVQFLTDPRRYTSLGARIPKGVLLYGPPGCGKTLMARALAGEARAAFLSISGADFMELYVGVGAARVRELFREAHEDVPAIVFIDELDAIGRSRGVVKTVASHGEQEQALNQILTEMDGFSPLEGIIVVGATNRPDVLDQALLRPGRFDRSIGLERPDEAGRLAILGVHARGKRLDTGVDLAVVARRAIGLTGADLGSVMNEAALLAGRAGKGAVSSAEVDAALRRILEAPDRQRRLSMRDRRVSHRHSGPEDRVTFADVAGVGDVVQELAEVRDYLADPERYARLGVRIPRGILLDGPPGCGKTLLARAVAGEANAAFLSVAATEFVEVFVGEGAARVRDLFAEARSIAPSIVFIDELDAVGARRSTVALDGNREQEQTLNQILVELDGFEPRSGVIVMGATNRVDILDPALVRPGRFDLRLTLSLPGRQGRREILTLHARGRPLAPDVDLDLIAGLTQGFSGAALANVLSESMLLAARQGLDRVPMRLVEEAIERGVRGVTATVRALSQAELRMAAYHEAGHAIVGRALPQASVPHRLTIVPRGDSLGGTWNIPTDRVLHPRSFLVDQMTAMLGGRAAECLVFGEPGSGASDDLEQVAALARRMVCQYGMSEAAGWLAYGEASGRGPGPGYSEETARLIDAAVRALVASAGDRALALLAERRGALDRVAAALLEREVLTAEEFEAAAGDLAATNGAKGAPPASRPARATRPGT